MRQYRLGHPGRVVAVVLGREVCRRPRDHGDGRDDAVDAEPGELPLRGEAEVAALVGGEDGPGKPDIHSATSPHGLPRNLLVTASPVSASSAQTVVDLRCTSIPKAVEYLGTGASQPRCGAAAPLALQQHCRSPDPRSRAGGSCRFRAPGLGHSVCRCQDIGVALLRECGRWGRSFFAGSLGHSLRDTPSTAPMPACRFAQSPRAEC